MPYKQAFFQSRAARQHQLKKLQQSTPYLNNHSYSGLPGDLHHGTSSHARELTGANNMNLTSKDELTQKTLGKASMIS
jgi:hypothetical protein